MKTLSFKLTKSLDSRIAAMAKERRVSKSAVVREALEFFFANGRHRKKKPSAYDLAKDLIGCVEGPGDLSYNPKYMEGFGE